MILIRKIINGIRNIFGMSRLEKENFNTNIPSKFMTCKKLEKKKLAISETVNKSNPIK